MIGQKFVDIVKVREYLEDGFKNGQITNLTALQANKKATRLSHMDTSNRKEEEVCMVTTTHMQSDPQRKYQNPYVNQKKFPRPNFRKDLNVFAPLRECKTKLYERL